MRWTRAIGKNSTVICERQPLPSMAHWSQLSNESSSNPSTVTPASSRERNTPQIRSRGSFR